MASEGRRTGQSVQSSLLGKADAVRNRIAMDDTVLVNEFGF